MSTNKLTVIIESLRTAAMGVKAEIQAFDAKIAEANAQRAELINAPLSLGDYLSVMRADIQAKAKRFSNMLVLHLEKQPVTYAGVMRGKGALYLNILDVGRNLSSGLSEEAAYYYLEEELVKGVEVAAQKMEWPDDAPSMADRAVKVAALDEEIAKLNTERDRLAGQLIGAGVTQ